MSGNEHKLSYERTFVYVKAEMQKILQGRKSGEMILAHYLQFKIFLLLEERKKP
jgi:hypothetical protein